MNIFTAWRQGLAEAYKLKKLKKAFKAVESAGYFVCNIQQRGGVNYLVDGKGGWHKIGKRA